MSDSARDWVVKLTVSRPDTAEREMARRALDAYFARTTSEQAVRNFLALSSGVSARQKRILADLIAPFVTPGEPFRTLLAHGDRKWARRAARAAVNRWDDNTVGAELLDSLSRALDGLSQSADARRTYSFVDLLLTSLVEERPTVPLRPIERLLAERLKREWNVPRRRQPLPTWYGQVSQTHYRLTQALAPPDTPLPTRPPTLGADGLPVPSEGSATSAANLPAPATPGAPGASEPWWKRWIKRFRR